MFNTKLYKAYFSCETMTTKKTKETKGKAPSKAEEIAFHRGALQSLAMEYNELAKIAQNVQGVMGAHLKRLEELGVKIQQGKPKKE